MNTIEKLKIILKAAYDLECSLTISSKDCKKFYEALSAIDERSTNEQKNN